MQAGFNLESSHRRWSDLYLLQQRSARASYSGHTDTVDPCLDVHIQGKKAKGPCSVQDPLNDPTGGFLLQLPRYTMAIQSTLHSEQQHQQSAKLSNLEGDTMRPANHRHSANSLSCYFLISPAKYNDKKVPQWIS